MLLRTRVAVDQARLTRLATQTAIERSRTSLAETRALIVALRFAARNGGIRRPPMIEGNAAEPFNNDDIAKALAVVMGSGADAGWDN
jgi:hypothetical protein